MICKKCGIKKPDSGFDKNKTYKSGFSSCCITCRRAYDKVRNKLPHRSRVAYSKTVRGRAVNNAGCKKWRNSHRLESSVQQKLRRAVKSGRVDKHPCEVCGDVKVHGHHDDYSKPLSVRWLCHKHHREHHLKEREKHENIMST